MTLNPVTLTFPDGSADVVGSLILLTLGRFTAGTYAVAGAVNMCVEHRFGKLAKGSRYLNVSVNVKEGVSLTGELNRTRHLNRFARTYPNCPRRRAKKYDN